MRSDTLTDQPKVLIVDDLPENLFAMQQLLADVDAELFTAHSGNEALGLMLQHRFCVVLLDVQMPEMDGFETAELMRSHEETKATPIIFLTAINKEDRHVFHGYASGAVDYLFKPVVPEILLGKVRVFIDLYRALQLARQLEREKRKSANLESIGSLAGGLAHDFNNLLFAILGNIELAEDQILPNPDQAAQYLVRAKNALRMGKDLTSMLITFSKGGQPMKKPCQLETLLRESVDAMVLSPGIAVVMDLPKELPPVDLDWRLMQQAVENILTNACEAMPDGGKLTISIDSSHKDPALLLTSQDTPQVTVRIADTGVGISEEHLDQVFDPYFSTKQKSSSKGMGLGLSVASSIIRNHHGAIAIQSAKGVGTTVQFVLPASKPQGATGLAVNLAAEKRPTASGQMPRILVMDEDEMAGGMTCQMLGNFGFQADWARNSREAFDQFSKANHTHWPYSVVILDMTVQDGEEGRQALRAMRAVALEVRAVALVLLNIEATRATMLAYGFNSTPTFMVARLICG